jgi:hypothetical protein
LPFKAQLSTYFTVYTGTASQQQTLGENKKQRPKKQNPAHYNFFISLDMHAVRVPIRDHPATFLYWCPVIVLGWNTVQIISLPPVAKQEPLVSLFLLFSFNELIDFFAMNTNFFWCVYTDSYLIAFDAEHGHCHFITDHQCLIHSPRKY